MEKTDLTGDADRFAEEPDGYARQGQYYEDEPIRLSPEQAKRVPPKEYRKMRDLAFGSAFDRSNEAKIFYLQAKYMENFEDDCPYGQEVLHYYPTYQSFSTPELRGYFTWRTRLRRGELEKTSLSYAYLYLYELLHQIGSETKEEGFGKLLWFYEQYSVLDPGISRYARRWIVDYAVYYGIPAEQVRAFSNAEFDEALLSLQNCDTASDEALFSAVLRLSSYHLERSKTYRQYPEELRRVVCEAYRKLNARYFRRYGRSYAQKLYGNAAKIWYRPFLSAVFYEKKRVEHYEYRLSPLRLYICDQNIWSLERGYLFAQKNRVLGEFVRAADRMMRESFGIRPALKAGTETKTMVRFLSEAIDGQKRAAKPEIEFDLSKLSDIRRSSDTVGQKLMTEEERYTEDAPKAAPKAAPGTGDDAKAVPKAAPGTGDVKSVPKAAPGTGDVKAVPKAETGEEDRQADCILSGNELRFLQILLYGGDLQGFLAQNRLMASVLAEAVNERLFDEFADTVIEFDGNTPVIVEDYRDDLKGMIPS